MMRIGDVARHAGVSVKAVRYYERIGILTPALREPNGYRTYEPEVLDRIAFTRAAQAIGLTLGEIKEVIAFRERGQPPCTHVLALITRHADELNDRISELEALRTELERLTQRGSTVDPADCSPTSISTSSHNDPEAERAVVDHRRTRRLAQ